MSVHFVLRIPLITEIGREKISTIDAHNDAFKKHGRVAVAKFGKAGTTDLTQILAGEIKEDRPIQLVLVAKRDSRFLGYTSHMIAVHRGKPTEEITGVAPDYYRKIDSTPEFWFIVDRPFARCELTSYRLLSNQRPLLKVMAECRTAAMLVELPETKALA